MVASESAPTATSTPAPALTPNEDPSSAAHVKVTKAAAENDADFQAKKRRERLEQNRISARESRKRKKNMIEELQRTVITLSRESKDLNQTNESIRRQLMEIGTKHPGSVPFHVLMAFDQQGGVGAAAAAAAAGAPGAPGAPPAANPAAAAAAVVAGANAHNVGTNATIKANAAAVAAAVAAGNPPNGGAAPPPAAVPVVPPSAFISGAPGPTFIGNQQHTAAAAVVGAAMANSSSIPSAPSMGVPSMTVNNPVQNPLPPTPASLVPTPVLPVQQLPNTNTIAPNTASVPTTTVAGGTIPNGAPPK